MTPAQLQLLHLARRQLGIEDRAYRVILRNVADVASSTKLTNESFEDVMAVFEDRGFRKTGCAEDFFRNKVRLRGQFATERAVHGIRELATGGLYPLEALCRRFSEGRTDQVTKLAPREAWALTEMLKSKRRQGRPLTAQHSAPPTSDHYPIPHGGEEREDVPF